MGGHQTFTVNQGYTPNQVPQNTSPSFLMTQQFQQKLTFEPQPQPTFQTGYFQPNFHQGGGFAPGQPQHEYGTRTRLYGSGGNLTRSASDMDMYIPQDSPNSPRYTSHNPHMNDSSSSDDPTEAQDDRSSTPGSSGKLGGKLQPQHVRADVVCIGEWVVSTAGNPTAFQAHPSDFLLIKFIYSLRKLVWEWITHPVPQLGKGKIEVPFSALLHMTVVERPTQLIVEVDPTKLRCSVGHQEKKGANIKWVPGDASDGGYASHHVHKITLPPKSSAKFKKCIGDLLAHSPELEDLIEFVSESPDFEGQPHEQSYHDSGIVQPVAMRGSPYMDSDDIQLSSSAPNLMAPFSLGVAQSSTHPSSLKIGKVKNGSPKSLKKRQREGDEPYKSASPKLIKITDAYYE